MKSPKSPPRPGKEGRRTAARETLKEQKSGGYRGVPRRSLAAEIELGKLIVDGMKKRRKDPDYPKVLDTLDVAARTAAASAKLVQQSVAQRAARKAGSDAVQERHDYGEYLDRIYVQLLANYGRDELRLLDYGFRPREKPAPRKKPPAE